MNYSYEHREQQMQVSPLINFVFNEHLHKETEIVLVLEGTLHVKIQNSQKSISAGEAAIIFPNMIHSYQTVGHSRGILIIFDMYMAGDYEKHLTGYHCMDPFISKENLPEDVPTCLQRLMQEDLKQQVPNVARNTNFMEKTALSRGYIAVLLGNLFKVLHLEKISNTEKHTTLNTVLAYVTDHYREPVTLENIAAETGIGKYTISRIFNHELHCGLNEYLNSMRIGYAQHLLSNHNLPVTEIAYESGFSSLRTFNRAFREVHDLSPREYRKQLSAHQKASI